MAECKFKIHKGNGGRYTKNCGCEPVACVIFSTELDAHYIITTQLPLCNVHLQEKSAQFTNMGLPFDVAIIND